MKRKILSLHILSLIFPIARYEEWVNHKNHSQEVGKSGEMGNEAAAEEVDKTDEMFDTDEQTILKVTNPTTVDSIISEVQLILDNTSKMLVCVEILYIVCYRNDTCAISFSMYYKLQ